MSEGRTGTVPVVNNKEQQGLPRWDTRWPIDVWVSCGEPFVPLEGMFRAYLSVCAKVLKTSLITHLEGPTANLRLDSS